MHAACTTVYPTGNVGYVLDSTAKGVTGYNSQQHAGTSFVRPKLWQVTGTFDMRTCVIMLKVHVTCQSSCPSHDVPACYWLLQQVTAVGFNREQLIVKTQGKMFDNYWHKQNASSLPTQRADNIYLHTPKFAEGLQYQLKPRLGRDWVPCNMYIITLKQWCSMLSSISMTWPCEDKHSSGPLRAIDPEA